MSELALSGPGPRFQPATITKPMQLLAAWLLGLLALDGCFLLAATRLPPGSTESSALVWAAILNVPLFLGALFLLQTKFRPELQEDLYYATYINQKTNQTISVSKDDQRLAAVLGRIEKVEMQLKGPAVSRPTDQESDLLAGLTFGVNRYLLDSEELSTNLLRLGVPRHTWFGSKDGDVPNDRVVAVSVHLLPNTRDAVFAVAERLGFSHYSNFDNLLEESDEDVLIGAYGIADGLIPRTALALRDSSES